MRWHEQQKILWALDDNDVHALQFDEFTGTCELIKSYALPSKGGHDLSWYDDQTLYVSVSAGVFFFNIHSHEFRPHPQLAHCEQVKGISRHPVTGETVYVFPDPGETVYTSHDLHFLPKANKIITAPHAVYKPRWMSD